MKMMVMMTLKRQCYRQKHRSTHIQHTKLFINQGHQEKIDLEWQAAQNFHPE